jgi:uncharacterized protein YbcI
MLVASDANRCRSSVADQEHTSTEEQSPGGRLNHDITNAVVRSHRRYVGRGPTRAQTFYHHNIVVVVLQDVLTVGERSIAADGHHEMVDELRSQLQQTMRGDLVGAVERLTGCQVEAFMSANHIEPDLALELFVLDRPVPSEPPAPATATADRPAQSRPLDE